AALLVMVQVLDGSGGVVDLLENVLPATIPDWDATRPRRVQGLPALRPPAQRSTGGLKAPARS
ncbi:MAG TPA: hypothetical protein VJ996_05050, partial [Solirubrobacteraceae bacterium]|nr:hypothetical protein [Solirubrobacteraceae bacterium]